MHNITEIFCFWSRVECAFILTEPQNLAKMFSNGYLIGEVLSKYEMQKDFTMFTDKS